MSTDPLSDILRLTEARSVVSGGYAIGGTWGFRTGPPGVISFAAIASGSCWIRLEGADDATKLDAGDVGLLSGRVGWSIGSSPTAPTIDVTGHQKRSSGILEIGPTRDCVVIFGRVSLDASSAELLTEVLPAAVLIRAASASAASLRWLIEALVAEQTSQTPGSSVASEKLAELFFVQVLRAEIDAATLPTGWFRALRDERMVRALRAMHGEPARAWTLEELAKTAGMSRTRFALAFKTTTGVAPLAYLTTWRMRLARRELRERGASIRELAESLGYASEGAFSSAFKRIVGVSPRAFRSACLETADAPAASSMAS